MELDGPSALETTLPFDERQVLEENRAYLYKALEVCVELVKGSFWLIQFCFWCFFHNLKRNASPTPQYSLFKGAVSRNSAKLGN